jgi:hypothetical protein
MSLAEQFAGAVEHAQFHELSDLERKVWKAWEVGHLDDDQAQGFAEQIKAKRPKAGTATTFKPPKVRARQRSPDKARSIARRRRLAKYAPLPPDKIEFFTTCELAALYIVIDEIMKHGRCSLYIALIAARAGTCATVVRNALDKARDKELLYTNERRRRGQKSLANITWIANRSWGEWLRKIWDPRRRNWSSPESDPGPPGYRKKWSTDDTFKKGGNAPHGERSGESFWGVEKPRRYEMSRA